LIVLQRALLQRIGRRQQLNYESLRLLHPNIGRS
jgi:hypothetical protein